MKLNLSPTLINKLVVLISITLVTFLMINLSVKTSGVLEFLNLLLDNLNRFNSEGKLFLFIGILLAMPAIVFTITRSADTSNEEKPKRNVPKDKGIRLSLAIYAMLFVGLVFLLAGLLPRSTVTASQESGERSPSGSSLAQEPTPTLDETSEPDIQAYTFLLPDGSTPVSEIMAALGDLGPLNDIAMRDEESLKLWVPKNWPYKVPNPFPTQMKSYLLPNGGDQPCNDWINRYNTVSMKVAVEGKGTIILFFGKEGVRLFVPFSGKSNYAVLDNYFRGQKGAGNGPFNASLQVILVPDGVKGTVTVYDQNNFKGRSCLIDFR